MSGMTLTTTVLQTAAIALSFINHLRTYINFRTSQLSRSEGTMYDAMPEKYSTFRDLATVRMLVYLL